MAIDDIQLDNPEFRYIVAVPPGRVDIIENLRDVIASAPRMATQMHFIEEAHDVGKLLHLLKNERPRFLFLHVNLPLTATTPMKEGVPKEGLSKRILDEIRAASPITGIVGFVPSFGRDEDRFEFYGLPKAVLLREDRYRVTDLNDGLGIAREIAVSMSSGKTVIENKQIVRDSRSGVLTERGVICVNAAKGGAGKTFISVHVAAGLAQAHKVLLLDFNASGGMADNYFNRHLKKIGSRLDIERENSLYAFERNGGWDPDRPVGQQIDPAKIEEVLIWIFKSDDGSGLALLPGLEYKTDAGARMLFKDARWVPEFFDKVLRSGFKYIVIDTGQEYFAPLTKAALERADLFIDVANGRSANDVRFGAKQVLDLTEKMERMGQPLTSNRGIVINQWHDGLISMGDAQRWYEGFNARFIKKVTDDVIATGKASHERTGTPIFFSGEQTTIRNDLTELVNTINLVEAGSNGRQKKGFSLFGRK